MQQGGNEWFKAQIEAKWGPGQQQWVVARVKSQLWSWSPRINDSDLIDSEHNPLGQLIREHYRHAERPEADTFTEYHYNALGQLPAPATSTLNTNLNTTWPGGWCSTTFARISLLG